MDNDSDDDYARLIAEITVIKVVIIQLTKKQPVEVIEGIRRRLNTLVASHIESTMTYGESMRQSAEQLLDSLDR